MKIPVISDMDKGAKEDARILFTLDRPVLSP